MADDKIYPSCTITNGMQSCNNRDALRDDMIKKQMNNEQAMDDTDFMNDIKKTEEMNNKATMYNSQCMCGCVGYAYVPWQMLNQTYNVEESLENGTVFPELNLTMEEYGKVCKQKGGSNNGDE